MFYLVEYCPHTPPAQGLSESKGENVGKGKTNIPRNVDTLTLRAKCPSNLKCPKVEKRFTETMCPVPTAREKEGGEKEETEL